MQAIDRDSLSRSNSPTPKPQKTPRKAVEKQRFFDREVWAARSPFYRARIHPESRAFPPAPDSQTNNWIEVNRGSGGQGSSRGDAKRGRRQKANVASRDNIFTNAQTFHLPEGSGQATSIHPGISERGLKHEQPTTPGRLPVVEDVVV